MSRRIMRTVLGAAAALTMTTVVGFPAMAEGKTIRKPNKQIICFTDSRRCAGCLTMGKSTTQYI